MKKLIALLFVVALVFSFCACGNASSETNATPSENLSEEEKQYENACALIEEGKYEDAIAILSEMETYKKIVAKITEAQELLAAEIESAKPESHPIEITLDNWEEYFEIGSITGWGANAFNETDNFNIMYYLKLKDQYEGKVDFDKSTVALEYECDYTVYTIDVNFDSRTYELKEEIPSLRWHSSDIVSLEHKGNSPFGWNGIVFEETADWDYWAKLIVSYYLMYSELPEPQLESYPYSLEVIRIGGDLYLFD